MSAKDERRLLCPRCGSDETRRTRRFGKPLGNEQWCTKCGHRWEPPKEQIAAAEHTASFRAQTGKRKGEAFCEDGVWCVLDAAGHQWEWHDGEWPRFTDEDDPFVLETARAKRKGPKK